VSQSHCRASNLSPLDHVGIERERRSAEHSDVSFRYSHFRSRYLAYDPIVNGDANGKLVQPVPKKVGRAWARYSPLGYPFSDFGGKAILNNASFAPRVLAKLTRKQIAADLSRPKWRVAKAIDGSANQLTAAICIMTDEKPRKGM
jgi:hypothetical protein